eukprot:GHVP01056045.1.p1 GENE.GHVP01056045.1~~GHVP01056045.1.p1  ORF type:complete len:821 (-),score=147.82 GHVP01056045.1:2698-5160(-)
MFVSETDQEIRQSVWEICRDYRENFQKLFVLYNLGLRLSDDMEKISTITTQLIDQRENVRRASFDFSEIQYAPFGSFSAPQPPYAIKTSIEALVHKKYQRLPAYLETSLIQTALGGTPSKYLSKTMDLAKLRDEIAQELRVSWHLKDLKTLENVENTLQMDEDDMDNQFMLESSKMFTDGNGVSTVDLDDDLVVRFIHDFSRTHIQEVTCYIGRSLGYEMSQAQHHLLRQWIQAEINMAHFREERTIYFSRQKPPEQEGNKLAEEETKTNILEISNFDKMNDDDEDQIMKEDSAIRMSPDDASSVLKKEFDTNDAAKELTKCYENHSFEERLTTKSNQGDKILSKEIQNDHLKNGELKIDKVPTSNFRNPFPLICRVMRVVKCHMIQSIIADQATKYKSLFDRLSENSEEISTENPNDDFSIPEFKKNFILIPHDLTVFEARKVEGQHGSVWDSIDFSYWENSPLCALLPDEKDSEGSKIEAPSLQIRFQEETGQIKIRLNVLRNPIKLLKADAQLSKYFEFLQKDKSYTYFQSFSSWKVDLSYWFSRLVNISSLIFLIFVNTFLDDHLFDWTFYASAFIASGSRNQITHLALPPNTEIHDNLPPCISFVCERIKIHLRVVPETGQFEFEVASYTDEMGIVVEHLSQLSTPRIILSVVTNYIARQFLLKAAARSSWEIQNSECYIHPPMDEFNSSSMVFKKAGVASSHLVFVCMEQWKIKSIYIRQTTVNENRSDETCHHSVLSYMKVTFQPALEIPNLDNGSELYMDLIFKVKQLDKKLHEIEAEFDVKNYHNVVYVKISPIIMQFQTPGSRRRSQSIG